MKKHLMASTFLAIGSWAFAQCNIIGNSHISFNETAEYIVDTDAQCPDCYQWKNSGNNAVLMGTGTQKTIGLKGSGSGQTILNATVLTPQGVSMCSKVIEVVGSSYSNNDKSSSTNCDIDINDFKEAKIGNGILALFPNATENVYNYLWTATYASGDTRTSNEKVPQLPYPFHTLKLKITSKKCYKEYTKTYNDSYWKFFN